MEYFIIGLIIISVAIGVILLWKYLSHNKANDAPLVSKGNLLLTKNYPNTDEMNSLMIQLEQLPFEAIPDESKLMELTDRKLLACVNNLVPELFQSGNAIANTAHAVQESGKVLYQAVLPAGAKLADSTQTANAVRGFYHGSNGIKGHADFLAVKQNANVAANVASSAMNVASMVVGQYYMEQINKELEEINSTIKKISDFQDSEYKSKVYALMVQVQKITQFQVEILDNEELRLSELSNLNRWEQECIQLLGQANDTVANYANKKDLNYKAYEVALTDVQKWVVYQKSLMEVLTKTAELKYVLHLGTVSKEHCCALLPTYSNQVQASLELLRKWHQSYVEQFEISVDDNNRKRTGLDSVIHFIPGLINEQNKYRSISDNTTQKIIAQTSEYRTASSLEDTDLFQEDVHIIAKDGKIYYLPSNT